MDFTINGGVTNGEKDGYIRSVVFADFPKSERKAAEEFAIFMAEAVDDKLRSLGVIGEKIR